MGELGKRGARLGESAGCDLGIREAPRDGGYDGFGGSKRLSSSNTPARQLAAQLRQPDGVEVALDEFAVGGW